MNLKDAFFSTGHDNKFLPGYHLTMIFGAEWVPFSVPPWRRECFGSHKTLTLSTDHHTNADACPQTAQWLSVFISAFGHKIPFTDLKVLRIFLFFYPTVELSWKDILPKANFSFLFYNIIFVSLKVSVLMMFFMSLFPRDTEPERQQCAFCSLYLFRDLFVQANWTNTFWSK